MFNPVSLDYVYYPVSAILWFWHKVFGFVLGADSGIAWGLAVVLLVCTLRAILFKPFVKQIRTTRQMQEFQPQMQALRKKYGKDRQKLALEMQKLQKEHGFNPLLGCLPALLQVPVFIGLYHVLRSFNRMASTTGGFFGGVNMTAEQTRNTPNYFFSVQDVQSFLDARLFGVPLSAYVQQPQTQWDAFMRTLHGPFDFQRWEIIALAIPLMIIAGVATHMNARASIARQTAAALDNPQTAIMNKLMLWVFPLGVLVGGIFLPIAILLYWVTQNIWTYFQQHLVFGRLDKEDAEKKALAEAKRAENAPKPGAKPSRNKGGGKASGGAKAGGSGKKATPEDAAVDLEKSDAPVVADGSTKGGTKSAGGASKPGTPKPGARPSNQQRKKRKR
ncbi:membrane protein insertase YidC [Tsukamurella sp. 8F]|uniref:membrane protein insertase YidC n=1 Tax=unclassified Tsukamurella TaxID=2633480 RepID=UPI0023B8FBB9|nr:MULTISPECIES: membrane protein insertase YidC [unclassified Tsukamurella]MDF0529405.1 membrane protein insertase YidC [Tsukamurella sp. 8J]MDF0587088.1 membrane protein insertase YidC [Tsukamurella sp. 8F]